MFFHKKCGGGIDYIIAGLGNPGREYEDTRHNMGFRALDILAYQTGANGWKTRKKGLECKVRLPQGTAVLVKPQTFMNKSGECLQETLAFYKLAPERLIVIYDDIDLGVGAVRVRPSGGAGTHNGMRSIVPVVGENFPRIRVGVGKPERGDLADYVLGRPQQAEQKLLEAALEAAAQAALCIMSDGAEKAMQRFNGFKAEKKDG